MIKTIVEMVGVAAAVMTLAFALVWAFTDAALTEAALPGAVHIARVVR